MPPIRTSIFDLFKIGPGPSSSHTIGPMRAALEFSATMRALPDSILERAASLEVRLFGSLSATGLGHGTHRAILAGLLGMRPESCDPVTLLNIFDLPQEKLRLDLNGRSLPLTPSSIVFDALEHGHPYSNTMLFRLLGPDGEVLLERTCYSVGGGFIQWQGQSEQPRGEPAHSFETMADLRAIAARTGQGLPSIVLENELAMTGAALEDVIQGLNDVLDAMLASVERGVAAEGLLPGAIGLRRKAKALYERSRTRPIPDRFLVLLNAYALAAAEENAAGSIVVTAPTSGSAGVMPAVLALLRRRMELPRRTLREGLLAAAAIGFLAKHNASIAGAEVGCQGEVGVASAMAAACVAHCLGQDIQIIEHAAEIALEHHLGLTCDPVAGLVQIPCIERNAMGAVKAYNAYILAAFGDPAAHVVGLDRALWVMRETGRDMLCKYKETSMGGLALSPPTC
ncbi:L-serine ammonia-lyase [Desulfocurvibacter africanus PCS]|uniref:L-serine dehydratase n=1 Tax=Desulfocurvibacter africanus PCS TaxID=1262666 RepID=M5PQP4_DESAF|nr:L-serine ammonia-lyase [Desulfocurvibacter africanus]EMG36677.1 L-serine ammonia-lyase [Desulfocurvibacter africanus PCS]